MPPSRPSYLAEKVRLCWDRTGGVLDDLEAFRINLNHYYDDAGDHWIAVKFGVTDISWRASRGALLRPRWSTRSAGSSRSRRG